MTTTTTHEADCRAFVAQHPTPNALRGVVLAEAGVITWADLAGVFTRALADGLRAVAPR